MEKINNNINLTNNEVKDILGTPPKWILRWGNLLLLLILLVMLTGSIFIRKPEMLVGTIEITPVKKEIRFSVPLNSVIDTVFIKDGKAVSKGDSLLQYQYKNEQHTIIATEAGYISIEQLLDKGSIIDQDTLVISIDPTDQTYSVKGVFPGMAINKVSPGQQLQIEIANYPKNDYGVLNATVINKPTIDNHGNSLIINKLINNTTTNFGKILPIRTLARGTGYMVISNKRLITWLLSK
jgi:hypothetical protein